MLQFIIVKMSDSHKVKPTLCADAAFALSYLKSIYPDMIEPEVYIVGSRQSLSDKALIKYMERGRDVCIMSNTLNLVTCFSCSVTTHNPEF